MLSSAENSDGRMPAKRHKVISPVSVTAQEITDTAHDWHLGLFLTVSDAIRVIQGACVAAGNLPFVRLPPN